MEWLKKISKERRLCSVWLDGERLYEWLAVDMLTSYIICEITTVYHCWQIPKPFAKQFLNSKYHGKVEFVCK
jgi:hypothetical protein